MKEDKVIHGLGNIEKNVVQKSRVLLSEMVFNLNLNALKILDLYLARINSREPARDTVVFEVGELEKAFGISRISKATLRGYLRQLITPISLADPDDDNTIREVALFSTAEAKRNPDRIWQVTLKCSEDARKYIFNIESIGYIKYRVKNIAQLSGKYSYILFMYLELNGFRHAWEEKIDDLKKIFRCEDRYEEFRNFMSWVLAPACKEINEKTDMKFTYEKIIIHYPTVDAIRFTVEKDFQEIFEETEDALIVDACDMEKATVEQDTGEKSGDQETVKAQECDMSEPKKEEWKQDVNYLLSIPLYLSPFWDLGFSKEQIHELEVALEIIPGFLPTNVYGDRDHSILHYVEEKIAEMERRNSETEIKDKFAYLIKMIKREIKDASRGKSCEQLLDANRLWDDYL